SDANLGASVNLRCACHVEFCPESLIPVRTSEVRTQTFNSERRKFGFRGKKTPLFRGGDPKRGTPQDTRKLIDLGLAKAVSEPLSEAAISMPGAFAGTPEFASPEQFAGVGVDIRSDLYSLGVTLWKMLTGQTPFRGSSVEVMYQHQHAPLPVEQLKGIPQPLVVLLEVLLTK